MRLIPLLSILFLLVQPLQSSKGINIFIFNPESKIRNVRVAKVSLEKYLQEEGIAAKVHIFANPKDFEILAARLKPDFAIVASYYYRAMKSRFQWKTLLSGYKNNRSGFNKILVTPKSIKNPRELRNKGIANVFMGEATKRFVDSQFLRPLGLSSKNVRIVTVSKDIDAIMALAFRQVQGAIVTQDSFTTLKRINPSAIKNLNQLRKLPQIAYPKVVAFTGAKETRKLKSSIQKLTLTNSGGIILRFLKITSFR